MRLQSRNPVGAILAFIVVALSFLVLLELFDIVNYVDWIP